ncbi:uncharacterized protein C8R40DRAFT_205185 [Lentinula edodes]|uniref:uncharacterized protein n=1 Tax=Lentinula edodes TaxID=5353 RepID=UPI001E8D70A0|nr:uncharacterized protein C8R40DRAFT_205185 [Lentinula edodes]KAH7875437.1 hypothetical protein C8R40DRAFT_205185 [Lentinula edodes]
MKLVRWTSSELLLWHLLTLRLATYRSRLLVPVLLRTLNSEHSRLYSLKALTKQLRKCENGDAVAGPVSRMFVFGSSTSKDIDLGYFDVPRPLVIMDDSSPSFASCSLSRPSSLGSSITLTYYLHTLAGPLLSANNLLSLSTSLPGLNNRPVLHGPGEYSKPSRFQGHFSCGILVIPNGLARTLMLAIEALWLVLDVNQLFCL